MDEEVRTVKPGEDIDVSHHVDMLHIERLADESIYIHGHTDSDDGTDYRYWLTCMDDGLWVRFAKQDSTSFSDEVQYRFGEYPDGAIAPERDIDDVIPVDNLRIERMGENAVWFAAYLDDNDMVDRHFLVECGGDGLIVRTYV